MSNKEIFSNNPLQGVGIEQDEIELVELYGW